MNTNLIYPNESYDIIGVCMEVHRILGPGLLEVVYKDAIEMEFQARGIPFQREKPYPVEYKGKVLPHRFFADFVVYDDIILEIKAQSGVIDAHIKYTLHYLALAKSPLALIVNFGELSLVYKRLVSSRNVS